MTLIANKSTDKQALVKSLKSEIALLRGKIKVDHGTSCPSLTVIGHSWSRSASTRNNPRWVTSDLVFARSETTVKRLLSYVVSRFILFAFISALSSSANASAKEEFKYIGAVREAAQKCIRKKDSSPLVCYVRATPSKCQIFVPKMLDELTPWAVCVKSCATASVWSSTFGECKREIS